jgi:hypothetical protein
MKTKKTAADPVARYTQGEWAFNSYETFSEGKPGERGYYVVQVPGRLIARFPFGESGTAERTRDVEGEQRANVHLFLASRKLLEALEQINLMACYASEENTDARAEMLLKIGETARAAVAEVTGGQQ